MHCLDVFSHLVTLGDHFTTMWAWLLLCRMVSYDHTLVDLFLVLEQTGSGGVHFSALITIVHYELAVVKVCREALVNPAIMPDVACQLRELFNALITAVLHVQRLHDVTLRLLHMSLKQMNNLGSNRGSGPEPKCQFDTHLLRFQKNEQKIKVPLLPSVFAFAIHKMGGKNG